MGGDGLVLILEYYEFQISTSVVRDLTICGANFDKLASCEYYEFKISTFVVSDLTIFGVTSWLLTFFQGLVKWVSLHHNSNGQMITSSQSNLEIELER